MIVVLDEQGLRALAEPRTDGDDEEAGYIAAFSLGLEEVGDTQVRRRSLAREVRARRALGAAWRGKPKTYSFCLS